MGQTCIPSILLSVHSLWALPNVGTYRESEFHNTTSILPKIQRSFYSRVAYNHSSAGRNDILEGPRGQGERASSNDGLKNPDSIRFGTAGSELSGSAEKFGPLVESTETQTNDLSLAKGLFFQLNQQDPPTKPPPLPVLVVPTSIQGHYHTGTSSNRRRLMYAQFVSVFEFRIQMAHLPKSRWLSGWLKGNDVGVCLGRQTCIRSHMNTVEVVFDISTRESLNHKLLGRDPDSPTNWGHEFDPSA
ncbi:hypothetical protein V1478_002985 [Vespula squamosa]|uniref:Uncharacterized protein n=1 Tax=Vespula squamosa TaxID=30214 RepID=A0ABD2BRP0_VESSQ